MKTQTVFIISLVLAIIIAVFAVINVNSVEVNYLFGTAEWPLILIVLGSVLIGAFIAGSINAVKIYGLRTELKKYKNRTPASDSSGSKGFGRKKDKQSTGKNGS